MVLVFVDFNNKYLAQIQLKNFRESNFGFMENVLRSLIANPKFLFYLFTNQDFEKKLKMILSLSEKKYFEALKENRNYMIQDSNKTDANDEVNAFIDNILKKKFKSLELKKK